MQPAACIALFWLLYLEVSDSMRRLEHAAGSGKSRSYTFGMEVAEATRCMIVLVAGLEAADGSKIPFVPFSFVVLWSAIQRGASIADSFNGGFERASGRSARWLAASVGWVWGAATRVVPLSLMFQVVRGAA